MCVLWNFLSPIGIIFLDTECEDNDCIISAYECEMIRHGLMQHSHVVLDEPLDFVAGVFVLAVFHGAVFKLAAESWWAEQDNSPANPNRKCHCSLAAPSAATLVISNVWGIELFWRVSARVDLLSVNVVALEDSLRVGVGEAVLVPQGAGCLQELHLSCALVISKEPWDKEYRNLLYCSDVWIMVSVRVAFKMYPNWPQVNIPWELTQLLRDLVNTKIDC